MHKYAIIFFCSNEDDAFVAEVPKLPGYATHGDIQEMALAEINMAMDLWIEAAGEFGDPVHKSEGEGSYQCGDSWYWTIKRHNISDNNRRIVSAQTFTQIRRDLIYDSSES